MTAKTERVNLSQPQVDDTNSQKCQSNFSFSLNLDNLILILNLNAYDLYCCYTTSYVNTYVSVNVNVYDLLLYSSLLCSFIIAK
jgi:hypothetical protein